MPYGDAPAKTYRVERKHGRCNAYVIAAGVASELDPRHDLVNHSPDGFEFGYSGSGPSQLALALLADAIGDKRALTLYHAFKRTHIAQIPSDATSFEWSHRALCDIALSIEHAESAGAGGF